MKCTVYIVLETFSLLFEKYSYKKEKYIFNFKIILIAVRNWNFCLLYTSDAADDWLVV